MRSRSFFPIRLFSWFVSQQLLYFAILLAVAALGLFFWLETMNLDPEVLSLARTVAAIVFLVMLTIMAVVSLFMARRLLIPLGRLIRKTNSIREFPFEVDDADDEALEFEEPGEWYELERALNKLGRDLRVKTIRLSREKTELRAIMSAVAEAVLALNSNREVLFFNPQFIDTFGLDAEIVKGPLTEVIRSPDVLEAYTETLETGHTIKRELMLEIPDQRTKHFQLSLAPLVKKHNQEIYGVVGIFHDITDLKHTERVRIDFVGNVSHELRTPLTVVNGYLQTLNADIDAGRFDSAKEFLSTISTNVGRLRSLVEDLLDLSTLESGGELNFEKLNLKEITESVLSQVNPKGHKILTQFEVAELNGDQRRIEQVLRNLVENAVRYIPEGKTVEVKWLKTPEGVQLRVKDDGPGIAPEHQSRLFERFYRVDQSRARERGGTGIGLSLVKHIVQRHGGQIALQSQLGKGSEFICEFPDA